MIKSSASISTEQLYLSQATFGTETISTYKSGGSIWLEIGSNKINTSIYGFSFTGVDSFVKYKNDYYICTTGVEQPPILR